MGVGSAARQFHADRQRLQLRLLDQQGDGRLSLLPSLHVKDALTRFANCIGSNVFTGINVNFQTRGHETSIPDEEIYLNKPRISQIHTEQFFDP